MFTLTPRFILSVRALYARDLQGQSGPRDMDSGFGFTSVSGGNVCRSAVVFAGQSEEGSGQEEEISMAERGTGSTGNGV